MGPYGSRKTFSWLKHETPVLGTSRYHCAWLQVYFSFKPFFLLLKLRACQCNSANIWAWEDSSQSGRNVFDFLIKSSTAQNVSSLIHIYGKVHDVHGGLGWVAASQASHERGRLRNIGQWFSLCFRICVPVITTVKASEHFDTRLLNPQTASWICTNLLNKANRKKNFYSAKKCASTLCV